MSRSISFPGLNVYINKIVALDKNALDIVKGSTAAGAEIVADTCKAELGGLPATSNGYAIQAWLKDEKTILSVEQLSGLMESMGLAPIRNDNGFINTKLGFDGYNSIKTRKYPNGQPNAMIARSVNSGSSVLDKNPFMHRTESKSRKKAEKAMEDYFDNETKKIMK